MSRNGINGLTDKQKVFVDTYLACWNGAEAARQAGYAFPRQSAWENLSKPYIRKVIRERLKGKKATAEETLLRISEIARGDIGAFLGKGGVIDLEKAKDAGLTHLIKSISWTKQGLRIELHDPLRALELIGKAHGMFKDKQEVEQNVSLKIEYVNDWRGA